MAGRMSKGVDRIKQIAALHQGGGSITAQEAKEVVKQLDLIDNIQAHLDAVANKPDHAKDAAARRAQRRLDRFRLDLQGEEVIQ
jgi:hypothetical protein